MGAAVDVVKFLLDCDPRVKFQKRRGLLPLVAASQEYGAAIEIIEVIMDAN